MTRHVIAVEGKLEYDKLIMPGALRWTDELLPVTVNFDPDMIIGVADAFQRNAETGEISAEIHLMDGPFETADQFRWQIVEAKAQQIDGMEMNGNPIYQIFDGLLREVSYMGVSVVGGTAFQALSGSSDDGPGQDVGTEADDASEEGPGTEEATQT